MALHFAPKTYERIEQTLHEKEKGILAPEMPHLFLIPEWQSRKTPKSKPKLGIDDLLSSKYDFLITPDLEENPSFFYDKEGLELGFDRQPKPWLSPQLLQKLEKMKKTRLKREEMVDLIENIAKTSVDFYQVESGKFIAVKFDGCIVESADSEIDLLLKIQGRKFDIPIFVWQVGSESFSGWRT